jgi:hypothetical protein
MEREGFIERCDQRIEEIEKALAQMRRGPDIAADPIRVEMVLLMERTLNDLRERRNLLINST